jgi:hypothetical protein
MLRAATPPLVLATLLLAAGCGNTVQSLPASRSALEAVMVSPFPVYWVGSQFNGMNIREVTRDPGGAVTIDYGNCLEGGQSSCVAPLRIVTSPNNSFTPGGAGPVHEVQLRGVTAREMSAGSTLIIPTGPVVLDIYADRRGLAHAAAAAAVPLTEASRYGQNLAAPAADTGYGDTILKGQIPAIAPVAVPRRRVSARHARR